MKQLAEYDPSLHPGRPAEPESLHALFGSHNGLDDGVNYNLENDALTIMDQMVNKCEAHVAEVSVRLRPYIRPTQGPSYFGKEKVIGARNHQNDASRNLEVAGAESSDVDQPAKHLILSYVAQFRLSFIDAEQALLLARFLFTWGPQILKSLFP